MLLTLMFNRGCPLQSGESWDAGCHCYVDVTQEAQPDAEHLSKEARCFYTGKNETELPLL